MEMNSLTANWTFVLVVAGAGLVSVGLMIRLIRSGLSGWEKAGGVVLLCTPILGPLLFWFVFTNPPPQRPLLKGDGPRGAYLHRWISIRPIVEEGRKGMGDMAAGDERDGKGK